MTYYKSCNCGTILPFDEKPDIPVICWRCQIKADNFKRKRKLDDTLGNALNDLC